MKEKPDFSDFKELFEKTSVGMIISDSDGVMEWVNSFAADMFGYKVNELLGKKVEIFLPNKLKERHVQFRRDYAKNPVPRSMGAALDLVAVKKDSSKVPIELSLSFYKKNERLQIVSVIIDISEKQILKEKLKQDYSELESRVKERTQELTDALEELNHLNERLQSEIELRKKTETQVRSALEKQRELGELKSRFVSMASHEFRTPLGGILTSVSLLSKYSSPEFEHKREKHINTIKNSVSHLTTVLNDFLSLDKLDQGKVGPNPSSFQLVNFIETTIIDVQKMFESKFQFNYEHIGEDFKLFQDIDMFRNILINLSSNAMKYSQPDSNIRLTTEKVGDKLNLKIQDEGIGIPESDQKHLFDRFFRAHNATTIQGTGLGLNIIHKYLEYMGGNIEFESKENVGSTFTVSFPVEIKK